MTARAILPFIALAACAAAAQTPDREALSLCRSALEARVRSGAAVSCPQTLKGPSRPLFVTLSRAGKPRGCAGTFQPQEATLGEELIAFTIRAATQDGRYPPVTAAELRKSPSRSHFPAN